MHSYMAGTLASVAVPVVTCPARVATLAPLWPLAAGMGTKTDRSSIRLERNRPEMGGGLEDGEMQQRMSQSGI